mmetsp:Transcript_34302/g.60042  ORF Transcript_34302/g.60042 Transcript_34302/m.60042 type:complete len:228 (-) Transcript_34302:68-751(-)
MDNAHSCSNCGGEAHLVCVCSNANICQDCVSIHMRQARNVHTFIPISRKDFISEGDNELIVIRRVKLIDDYRDFLTQEIDNIESFKQASLTSIQTASDDLAKSLSTAISEKIEKLSRDFDVAKDAALKLVLKTSTEQHDITQKETTSFFKKIREKYTSLKSLQCFKTEFKERSFENQIEDRTLFLMKCPTDQMLELALTLQERTDRLAEMKRVEEEDQECLFGLFDE